MDVATGTESKILVRVGRFTIAFRHCARHRKPVPRYPYHRSVMASTSTFIPGSIAISADRITKPTSFHIFCSRARTVPMASHFRAQPSAVQASRVLGIGGNKATSTPGGDATGGTQNNRARINALFADLHAESMDWATFTNNAVTANDPDGELRWKPYTPYP